MRRFGLFFSCILFATGAAAHAQVVPAATSRSVSVTAGGVATVLQPDYAGAWTNTSPYYPIAGASTWPLFGVGAYVDVKLKKWVQFEAEARFNRFNQYANIHEDSYLIGPRLPVYRFWKATVYGKGLVGFTSMDLGPTPVACTTHCEVTGRFTDVAFGGGLDIKLTRRLSFRAADIEYHYWPTWGRTSLSPYGAAMGFGYRVF